MINPFALNDKTVLVTGASSGIGQATALACSQMGAKVWLTGRDEERLSRTLLSLEGEGNAMLCADLSRQEGVDALLEWAPPLDGLVNNAGIVEILPSDFTTRERLERILDINTHAPIEIFAGLAKRRKLRKGASVVFVSSISGNFDFSIGLSMYAASKAAVTAFARTAAMEMAPRKIRVNAVCPGVIETAMSHQTRNGVISPEMLAESAKKYPLKRYGKPEEVAYGVVYLLSDAASFVTGTRLVIDGGFSGGGG